MEGRICWVVRNNDKKHPPIQTEHARGRAEQEPWTSPCIAQASSTHSRKKPRNAAMLAHDMIHALRILGRPWGPGATRVRSPSRRLGHAKILYHEKNTNTINTFSCACQTPATHSLSVFHSWRAHKHTTRVVCYMVPKESYNVRTPKQLQTHVMNHACVLRHRCYTDNRCVDNELHGPHPKLNAKL